MARSKGKGASKAIAENIRSSRQSRGAKPRRVSASTQNSNQRLQGAQPGSFDR